MEFSHSGYTYFIERYENEPDLYYYKRCWIITKNNPKNNEEYTEIERMSRMWININYLGCKYQENIMKEIGKLVF